MDSMLSPTDLSAPQLLQFIADVIRREGMSKGLDRLIIDDRFDAIARTFEEKAVQLAIARGGSAENRFLGIR